MSAPPPPPPPCRRGVLTCGRRRSEEKEGQFGERARFGPVSITRRRLPSAFHVVKMSKWPRSLLAAVLVREQERGRREAMFPSRAPPLPPSLFELAVDLGPWNRTTLATTRREQNSRDAFLPRRRRSSGIASRGGLFRCNLLQEDTAGSSRIYRGLGIYDVKGSVPVLF